MSNEDYLRDLLDNQRLTRNQIENLKYQRDAIVEIIEDEIGGSPTLLNAGSYAKGTMIRASYDLDIVLYWTHNFRYKPRNLYIEVGRILQSIGRQPISKRVGWEIPFPGDFHIDVIPGKKILDNPDYAYLFNSKLENRIRTNVKKQVNHVRRSGCQEVIKLLKLWKKRKNVPIKTFILEILSIEGCKGMEKSLLEPQLIRALEYISENILAKKVIDVANSNNIVSKNLSIEVKNRVKNLADSALDATYWRDVYF